MLIESVKRNGGDLPEVSFLQTAGFTVDFRGRTSICRYSCAKMPTAGKDLFIIC